MGLVECTELELVVEPMMLEVFEASTLLTASFVAVDVVGIGVGAADVAAGDSVVGNLVSRTMAHIFQARKNPMVAPHMNLHR